MLQLLKQSCNVTSLCKNFFHLFLVNYPLFKENAFSIMSRLSFSLSHLLYFVKLINLDIITK